MKKATVLLVVVLAGGILFAGTSFAVGAGGCRGKSKTPVKTATDSGEKGTKSG